MESVCDTCLKFYDECEVGQLKLDAIDLPRIIEGCTAWKFDCNDFTILMLCKDRNNVLVYIPVTHDRDFVNLEVKVATANMCFFLIYAGI